jgi:hypothetical protein
VKYLTWKLNFSDPEYGTGPEDIIKEMGSVAEGAWASENQVILGYTEKIQNEAILATWQVKNITQDEALAFCLAINSEAYLLPDGKITATDHVPQL